MSLKYEKIHFSPKVDLGDISIKQESISYLRWEGRVMDCNSRTVQEGDFDKKVCLREKERGISCAVLHKCKAHDGPLASLSELETFIEEIPEIWIAVTKSYSSGRFWGKKRFVQSKWLDRKRSYETKKSINVLFESEDKLISVQISKWLGPKWYLGLYLDENEDG